MTKSIKNKEQFTELTALDQEMLDSSDIEADDIVIPRLLLMQFMSDLVKNEKAKPGDIVSSITEQRLCSKEETLDLVILKGFKTLQTFEDGEWASTETWLPGFANLPYEEVVDDKTIKRQKVQNYYVVLAHELGSGEAFPHIISFKSTALKRAKKLNTEIKVLNMRKITTTRKIASLSVVKESHPKGDYYVPNLTFTGDTTPAQHEEASGWFQMINQVNARFDKEES